MKPPAYNGEEVQQISPEQGERNVAMAVCVQLAGRAIIRVVSRCEEAQDNCNLDSRTSHESVCLGKMANAVTRVVLRCEEAQENKNLDLSECQLMQVPDAVYHLMRHTELKRCDLSGNVITKLPPKFAVKFSLITELNLSHNQMSKLPEELSELQALERLDISHNTFIALPPVTCRIPQLKRLLANNNSIIDIDVERLRHAPMLEFIDLQANPLTPRMYDILNTLTRIRVELTPRQVEDWEDLTI
ncbi:Leucine-rich repeat-containing protein 20 [Habropoda laboriosa]|uniref:Leucine-rich repeat-containing protein 20 n=1 Tax=Habropoda laboriosa TaxID=597456 RepID=A0A0L7R577_9HYME|nr:Leucine-rich repeat-containing protein 20 [Habropoda laboriosa]